MAIPSAVSSNLSSKSNFLRDVQKLTIAELIEIYAYAEAIVETVREPLIILDGSLRVKSVNKGFLTAFRTTEKATVGKYFYHLGNGQWDIPKLRHVLETILPKKTVMEDFEVEHTFPTIGHKSMLLNARCVVLSEHRTKLILVAIEDISERKAIQERTERFISIASHELRTPLTSIKGFMQLLEKRLRDGMDVQTEHIMARVMSQLNLLNDLVQDLFDARRIREGTLSVKLRKVKLAPAISDAVEQFRFVTDSHKILLSGSAEAKVKADTDRLRQVITNLLTNAVKYSPGKSEVRVRIKESKSDITVAVSDDGIGIAKEAQKELFLPYYSRQNPDKKDGLGLGLYICSEIIKRHGGKIRIRSVPGNGSTFSFSLPKAETTS